MNSSGLHHEHSGGFHCFHRLLCVIGLKVDATASVENEMGPKPKAHRIQRRKFNAIVGGQAQYEHRVDSLLPKVASQSGIFDATIIEESAIAVDLPINTFLENPRPPLSF